jgi:hypothetical protein
LLAEEDQQRHESGGAAALRTIKQFLAPDEGALVEREAGGHAGESGEGVVVDDGFEEGEGLGRALAGV